MVLTGCSARELAPPPVFQRTHRFRSYGAQESRIDSRLASGLKLSTDDRGHESGARGPGEDNLHLAQIFVPVLNFDEVRPIRRRAPSCKRAVTQRSNGKDLSSVLHYGLWRRNGFRHPVTIPERYRRIVECSDLGWERMRTPPTNRLVHSAARRRPRRFYRGCGSVRRAARETIRRSRSKPAGR